MFVSVFNVADAASLSALLLVWRMWCTCGVWGMCATMGVDVPMHVGAIAKVSAGVIVPRSR